MGEKGGGPSCGGRPASSFRPAGQKQKPLVCLNECDLGLQTCPIMLASLPPATVSALVAASRTQLPIT